MSMLLELGSRTGTRTPADISLVPPGAWLEASGQGLLLPVDAEPEARFAAAPLIAIDFPVFHDGRGLSLATLLRRHIGFAGELRAVGDVHPELIHYLRRCGFDTALLPPHRTISATDPRLAPYGEYYQGAVLDPRPAFRRRERGL